MTRLCLSCILFVLATMPACAEGVDCRSMAEQAGASQGVPQGLMTAIAQMESGRPDHRGTLAPWPWTLNQGGRGSFHETRQAALSQLRLLLAQGVTNVDIGCMQINYRWHHDGFASVEAMMDPEQNTRYAARFLRALHDDLGSWEKATAAYHSMDARRGQSYLARVTALRRRGAGEGAAAPDAVAEDYVAVAQRVVGLLALPPQPIVAIAGVGDSHAPERPSARPGLRPLPLPVPDPAPMQAETAPERLRDHWSDVAQFRVELARNQPATERITRP